MNQGGQEMQKIQLVAVGVFMGFVVAMASGGLSMVRAQQQGPSPAEAQAALNRELVILDQMRPQVAQLQANLKMTSQMPMTPTDTAIQKELTVMSTECYHLWQADNGLTTVMQMELQMGAHNK
jgi:hypothetical protein